MQKQRNTALLIGAFIVLAIAWIGPLFIAGNGNSDSSKLPVETIKGSYVFPALRSYLAATSVMLIGIVILLIIFKDGLSKTLNEEKKAARIKWVCDTLHYTLLIAVAVTSAVFITSLFQIMQSRNASSIDLFHSGVIHAGGAVLFCVYLLFEQKETLTYFRSREPSTIVAAYYNKRHTDYLQDGEYEKAYDSLVKACQHAPYGVELWCQLAFLCEMFLHKTKEADEYIEKAKKIVEKKINVSNKEIACYENYLGYILCNRSQNTKGIKHIERSVELDPNPLRVEQYKKKLVEVKSKKDI